MPELPEVEVARANLERWAVGRTVTSVEAEASRVLRPRGAASLRPLVGARVLSVERTGKALMWRLDGARGVQGVYSHLGMTGKWVRRPAGEPVRFSRLRVTLDDDSVLHYADVRLFGRFLVVPGRASNSSARWRTSDPTRSATASTRPGSARRSRTAAARSRSR